MKVLLKAPLTFSHLCFTSVLYWLSTSLCSILQAWQFKSKFNNISSESQLLLHSSSTRKQNIEHNLQFSAIAWHFKATKRSLCIERIVTVDPTIKTSIVKRQFNNKEKQDDDNNNIKKAEIY